MELEKVDFRESARVHLNKAQALLSGEPEEDIVRYACLELRMAIEALAYERLQSFMQESSFLLLRQWTPKKILSELEQIDSSSSLPRHLKIEVEIDGEMKTLMEGEDYRLSAKWAHRAHNALGNFLHEPTILANRIGRRDVALAKNKEVIAELEKVLASRIWNWVAAQFAEFTCVCGFEIKRRPENLERDKSVACASCGKVWDVEFLEKGYKFSLRNTVEVRMCCNQCGNNQVFEGLELASQPEVQCSECGARFQFVPGISLKCLSNDDLVA